jgi:DNA-binding GntR family transcriptional regulator
MILEGEFLAVTHITQDEVAEMLGVSTTPAREGLLMLAAEGLAETSSRGFRILAPSPADIEDMFWAHAALAGELTARACRLAADQLAHELRLRHTEMLDADKQGHLERIEAANWQFHGAINRAAQAPKLLLLLQASLRVVPERFYGLVPGWVDASEHGHLEIVCAFEAHDPDAAGTAAHAHVEEAGRLLRAYYSDRRYWKRPGVSA